LIIEYIGEKQHEEITIDGKELPQEPPAERLLDSRSMPELKNEDEHS
jgi:hypothetical protein